MNATQFSFINTRDDYDYELIDQTLTLTLQALEADLDSFHPETLQGTIDVGGLAAGEYINLPVTLALDSAYTMTEDLTASVRIVDKNAQPEETKEMSTQESSTGNTSTSQESSTTQESGTSQEESSTQETAAQ